MGIVTVNQDYAKVLLDHLELEIPDKIKNKVKLSILLDKKGLELDEEDFPSDSKYVIAYDSTNIYHLCIGYNEQEGTKKKVESLAKVAKVAKEQKERKLKNFNEEIERAENYKKYLEGEISKLKGQKNIYEDLATDAKDSANKFLEKLNKEKEQYKKLVGKIERIRKNFLIRVLFRIYKLELD